MDEKTRFSLMVDLHRDGWRQGPGSEYETALALELARLDNKAPLSVADIGCGTGAATLVLASKLPNARITAVDLFPEFLETLRGRANSAGCSDRIVTLTESMESLPFAEGSFDLIWSEGAIYNMGFRKGLDAWLPFLKPGGVLAISEITWLRPDPPEEIFKFWDSEYPEIASATAKIATLESAGYDLLGYFALPSRSWIDNYYEPIEHRVHGYLERHANGPEAIQIVEMERREAELYRRYQKWFSYGFYIARKR
jgi:SAM-dependent methyltransferase